MPSPAAAVRWQRFVGPLLVAAGTTSGCTNSVPEWAILAVLGAAVTSVLMYFGIRERLNHPVVLPDACTIVTRGVPKRAWRAFLKHIVSTARSDDLYIRGSTLHMKNGATFPVSNYRLSARVLHLEKEQARRMMYAWITMAVDPLTDLSDVDQVIDFLNHAYIDFLNMMLESFDDVTGSKFTEAFGQLFIRRCAYQHYVWELADLFEPALLARYFVSREQDDAAAVMSSMLAGETAELAPEDVASLLPHTIGEDVSDEARIVNALVHLYCGRKLMDVYDAHGFLPTVAEDKGFNPESPAWSTYDEGRWMMQNIRQMSLATIFGHLNSAADVFGAETPFLRNPGLLRAGIVRVGEHLDALRERVKNLWDLHICFANTEGPINLPFPEAPWSAHMLSSTISILRMR